MFRPAENTVVSLVVITVAGTRNMTVVNRQQNVDESLQMVLVGRLCRSIMVAMPTTVSATISSPNLASAAAPPTLTT